MVEKPFRKFGSPYRISGSDREALPDVQKWSEDPRGCQGVVWRPSRMLVVGMPSRMSGGGREALADVWE